MKTIIAAVTLALFASGCATSNALIHLKPDYADLPADELRTVAAEIEAVVASGSESFTLSGSPEIKLETPEISQAIRTRAIRFPLVSEFLDTGFAIEEANGLLSVKRSGGYKKATTSQQRDRDALIVMGENGNRWTLYEGLAEVNNWPPRSLSAIQEIFFEARVALMKPGQLHEELPTSAGSGSSDQ